MWFLSASSSSNLTKQNPHWAVESAVLDEDEDELGIVWEEIAAV